jgi:hypothetical protein
MRLWLGTILTVAAVLITNDTSTLLLASAVILLYKPF